MDTWPNRTMTLEKASAILLCTPYSEDWKSFAGNLDSFSELDKTAKEFIKTCPAQTVEGLMRTLLERAPTDWWAADELVRVAGERAGDAIFSALTKTYEYYRESYRGYHNLQRDRIECIMRLARVGDVRSIALGLEAIRICLKEEVPSDAAEIVKWLTEAVKNCGTKASFENLVAIYNLPPTMRGFHTEDWGDTNVWDKIDLQELRSLAAQIAKERGIDNLNAEVTRRKQEQIQRQCSIINKRIRSGQCTHCGRSMGFLDKLAGRRKHPNCVLFCF